MLKNRSFLKMHGLGNDFVIIDSRKDGFVPPPDICRKIADRHRGVGYDQLIVLLKPKVSNADVYMHIINPDGSEAGACGNATRCVARLLFEESERDEAVVQTVAGLLRVSKESGGLIAVDFGPPRLAWNEIPLAKECDTLSVPLAPDPRPVRRSLGEEGSPTPDPFPCCVNMGNPHTVFFVPNAETVALADIGPKLEHHPMFPQRCNIEFAHIIDKNHIRMRVWERGTGITQACGSGACATLVAAVRQNLSERHADIILDGGVLTIEWRESDDHVIMTGSAALAFKGELSNEL